MTNYKKYFEELNKLDEEVYEVPELKITHIDLTEANLNRVVSGHDKMGYVILSASRQNLYKTPSGEIYSVFSGEEKRSPLDKELKPGSKEHTDANNIRTKKLLSYLRSNNYSYVPVYGGYKEAGTDKASTEKSFIVLPYDKESRQYIDFDTFADSLLKESQEFQQDTILIKYPNKNPDYYDCKSGKPLGYNFSSTVLNDITKEYFTALKGWGDISNKDSNTFTKGKPQRFSFEGMYMNDFPNTINEHRIRSSLGELVRLKGYPKEG